jgi:hypothetical protein
MRVALNISLSGPDLSALFRSVVAEPLFGAGQPQWLIVNGEEQQPWSGWERDLPGRAKSSASAHFAADRFISIDPANVVKAQAPWDVDVSALGGMLSRLPCALAAVRGIYPEWDQDPDLKPPLKSFGNMHFGYGTFAAFKGEGHDRLVSRRWVDHGGPWLAHHFDADVSLLQLHDLAADARTANAQLRRAQERLGPSDTGGLIQPNFKRKLQLNLQHSERDRRASIVVDPKREVTPREMLEAATLRGSSAAGADRHIDSVAFVYIDEPAARRDLHELWLHGLECWTYINGRETRIDDTYDPPPSPRPW